MGLEKLTLKSDGGEFSAMLNPKTFSLTDTIRYSKSRELRSLKFDSYGKKKVNIPNILLDTTGAIPKALWPMDGTIKEMIEKLKKVVFAFDDSIFLSLNLSRKSRLNRISNLQT